MFKIRVMFFTFQCSSLVPFLLCFTINSCICVGVKDRSSWRLHLGQRRFEPRHLQVSKPMCWQKWKEVISLVFPVVGPEEVHQSFVVCRLVRQTRKFQTNEEADSKGWSLVSLQISLLWLSIAGKKSLWVREAAVLDAALFISILHTLLIDTLSFSTLNSVYHFSTNFLNGC